MGMRCFSFDKNDPLKAKMINLKNNFEKVNIIGIGGSSKVKLNILIINYFFIIRFLRFGK